MEDEIQKAKKLLIENDYMVIPYKRSMETDADTCEKEGMICSDCSCHYCFMGRD